MLRNPNLLPEANQIRTGRVLRKVRGNSKEVLRTEMSVGNQQVLHESERQTSYRLFHCAEP